jgi:ribonuclease P protein component
VAGPRETEPATLVRDRRVRRRADFVRVQDAGAKSQARHFLLLASPTTAPDGRTRLGIVASKRVGGAVERNRAKRLVREIFRLHRAEFPRGADVVVVARPGAHELGLAAATAEILPALPPLARRLASPAPRRPRA